MCGSGSAAWDKAVSDSSEEYKRRTVRNVKHVGETEKPVPNSTLARKMCVCVYIEDTVYSILILVTPEMNCI